MRRLAPLLIWALLAAAGCSDRERLNPLDPGNPSTRGRPTGFVALAGDAVVLLRWDAALSPDVAGYRLGRRAAGDTAFVTLGADLPRSVTRYPDLGVANGVDHSYRLFYVLGNGTLSRPAEDTATPGAARPWVTDDIGGSLLRLTPDARHVAERVTSGLQSPTALDVDPGSGRVWVCDPYGAQLGIYDPAQPWMTLSPVVLEPVGVAVDRGSGHAWICDQGAGAVVRIAPDSPGEYQARVASLSRPLSVAVDPIDASVWVCERNGDRVRRIAFDGTPICAGIVIAPSRVAVDSLTRSAWVTSFTTRQLVRLSPTGEPRDTLGGLQGPIGVAVDSRRGRVWVADAAADQVVVFDRFGQELFRVSGLLEASEIGIDPVTGEAWVALPAAGAVAWLDAGGRLLRTLTGLTHPYAVAVERRDAAAPWAAIGARTR